MRNTLLPLLTLLFVSRSAVAEIPPPARPPPTIVGANAQDTDHLVILSDPLGQSDDRTASRLETVLRLEEPAFRACRDQALKAGHSPMRFLQNHVYFRTDGTIRRVKVSYSTGDKDLDACANAVILAARLDPPPMFPDHLILGVTWALAPQNLQP